MSTETTTEELHFRFDCAGGQIAVRRAAGGFDVRFPGLTSGFGLVQSGTSQPTIGSVLLNPDGSFHVTVAAPDSSGGGALVNRSDLAFVLLVF